MTSTSNELLHVSKSHISLGQASNHGNHGVQQYAICRDGPEEKMTATLNNNNNNNFIDKRSRGGL